LSEGTQDREGTMKHDMNNPRSTNHAVNHSDLASAAGTPEPLHTGELDADLAPIAAQLDRLAALDRSAARAGLEPRIAQVAAEAARSQQAASQHAASPQGWSASDAPAPISITAARHAAAGARPLGTASAPSWSLGSPLRIAAGLGLVAAVLGTLLAQRGSGTGDGSNLAHNNTGTRGVPIVTIASDALTPDDVALGEEILDEIAPMTSVTLASLDGDSSESARRGEFWSLEAFAEDSL
jgi:hypothetical protein